MIEQTFTFNCQKYEEVCKWFTQLVGDYRSQNSQVAIEWVDNTNHDISFNVNKQEPMAFDNNYTIVIFFKDEEHIINFLKFMLEQRIEKINTIYSMHEKKQPTLTYS